MHKFVQEIIQSYSIGRDSMKNSSNIFFEISSLFALKIIFWFFNSISAFFFNTPIDALNSSLDKLLAFCAS